MRINNYTYPTTILIVFVFILSVCVEAQTINCGGIGGVIRSQNVAIPQRGGGSALLAKIFAPDAALQTSPCPVVSILPGGGGSPISTVEWAAQRLAASGYVVIVTKPELPNSVYSYDNAARSGIDYALSSSSPFATSTDSNVVGVAGWSLGAFALSITQEQDKRVKAYVGWDNMVLSETGDAGSANCIGVPTNVRTPRVPAMGQASETCNDGRSPDAKKTAFEHWRAAGQPAMQLVFRNTSHFFWSDEFGDAEHDLLHYYTVNWFDRWLKGNQAATALLVKREVNSVLIQNVLSAWFRSAIFVDQFDCPDIGSRCSPRFATLRGRVLTPDGRGLRNASVSVLSTNGDRRITNTSSFGFFTLENVVTGQDYTVTVSSKRYRFAPRVTSIENNVVFEDFIGME